MLRYAVVKADGYGHGIRSGKTAILCFLSWGGFLDEALKLRKDGINAPILILGFTPESQFDTIIENDITQTVYNLHSTILLSEKQSNRIRKQGSY